MADPQSVGRLLGGPILAVLSYARVGLLFASLSRRSFTPCLFILAMGHLLRHVQNELAVFLVGLSQQSAQFIQIPSIFP